MKSRITRAKELRARIEKFQFDWTGKEIVRQVKEDWNRELKFCNDVLMKSVMYNVCNRCDKTFHMIEEIKQDIKGALQILKDASVESDEK